MNTYAEGMSSGSSDETTKSSGITKIIPTTIAEENSRTAVAGLKTMIPSIADNKKLYINHIDNLLDYCDLSILNIINNKLPTNSDKTYTVEAIRNLREIAMFSQIKDALIGSQAYVDL